MASEKAGDGFRTFDFSNVREDPFNRIHSAVLRDGEPFDVTSVDIPPDAFYQHSPEQKETDEELPAPATPGKIHPLLAKWVSDLPADERKEIIINLVDDLPIPRFPEPVAEEDADSLANQHVLAQSTALVDVIKGQRAPGYSQITAELAAHYNATVLRTYWLIRGLLVDMPLGSVKAVSKRDDVLYIEPRYAGSKPPANVNPNDDVIDGRANLNSDPYLKLRLSGGCVGLLDTGVFSHQLLAPPTRIRWRLDYTTDGDPTDRFDHGTASAAIIAGNGSKGPAFRGVTDATIDSFKIFLNSDNKLDSDAAQLAFQTAIIVGDRVIMANIAATAEEHDDIDAVCTAANNAFDAGFVVVAANGDRGTAAKSVTGPARASKVIGVGAFNVVTGTLYLFQGCGPAPGGRIKPDIQAPTDVETAYTNTATSDRDLATFGATSGATPFAAGAALLLRNWLRGTSGSIDPGQVYAFLILSGQQPRFDNTNGAGPIHLPTNGWAWWGKVNIEPGETCVIPIDINNTRLNFSAPQVMTFDGALWWPQSRSKPRNDIDLHIVDPTRHVRAKSNSRFSIFERARVRGSIVNGPWQFVIRGHDVTERQTVYWAAMVHSDSKPDRETHLLPG